MSSMSTDPGAQDGAVRLEAAADSDSDADAAPPEFLEQMYEQAMARLAVIIDEWQQAHDNLLRG